MKVVVTGAGPQSIGLATAVALRDLGHEVLVSTRTTPVEGFAWHPLDLADRGSVAAFADWVLASGGSSGRTSGEGVDALVNNAGIHLDLRAKWTQPQLLDGYEIHWRTNYLGTMQLTEALLPALLEQAGRTGDARIVHVVSQLHARGRNEYLFSGVEPYSSWKAYGTTKLALIHDAVRRNRTYADRGLRAVSAHPGKVLTKIADGGLANSPVLARLRSVARPIEKLILLTPEQGAETNVHVVTTSDLVGGGYYEKSAPQAPSADAQDSSVEQRLWEQTSDWLSA
ncbi:MAG TPA: SDR family NAD(P)-dependent oxidoreductase [Marmoricola sp.]|jgi:NAD(P)-dependent dehydrogenase (short-subunit alcohol dehydrogenase family)|nr:SDR family NAD(P)-dependent oxidoreductase [Marmoricola sp.]